ncbi:MAG: hypothetical protein K0R18_234 [Bacillales bacterium]|jgi:transcription antitermination factor NusA-like protein|nr:hypothetical protein [Bacillales bacterium]
MALKKEVQIRIDGIHVKGSVVAGKFRTSDLVNIEQRKYQVGITGDIIRKVIEELQELADIVDASEVTEELARQDDTHIVGVDWDSTNTNHADDIFGDLDAWDNL